jgi:uncharacterized protein
MSDKPQQPVNNLSDGWNRETSPYHPGEIAVQCRAGTHDAADRGGRRMIRDYMPDQHRAFFEALPYLFMGSLDARGQPWASILIGDPGFVRSPNSRSLQISALPILGDPASDNLHLGAPVGFVGIELHTRRRNRLTGRISEIGAGSFTVAIDQSFGNCPQYIQARSPRRTASLGSPEAIPISQSMLDEEASSIIAMSDTFFIASASPDAGSSDPVQGADINHRGGKPGFVRVEHTHEGTVLTAPDFAGNGIFNTLGNILLNPSVGLLFVDFASGTVITLAGTAEIIWDGPDVSSFARAQRLLRVRVNKGFKLLRALPWTWTVPEPARQLAATGDWGKHGAHD